MNEQEILEAIEIILYNPSYNLTNFFGDKLKFYIEEEGGVYKFSNKTVDLLLALSQKLVNEKERNFFWSTITPMGKSQNIPPLMPFQTKVRSRILRHQDFIFTFFLKSKKINEALEIIGSKNTVSSEVNKLLQTLSEVLIFEPKIFNKLQLDKILSIVQSLNAFICNANDYFWAKAEYQQSIAALSSPFPKNIRYEYVDIKELKPCENILKGIKDEVYNVKLSNLSLELLEGVNLEINQDQEQLKTHIKTFSFNAVLIETIDKIEQNLLKAEDKFDFKNCIGLIRTFFNELYISIALEIHKKTGIPPGEPIEGDKKMGKAIAYLRSKGILFVSEAENKIIEAFNAFLSYEGVHVLQSEKEHARISKNMAIELGLFLVKKLEKYIANIK